LSDALKGLREPGVWIDIVHFCGLQKRGDSCPGPTAATGSCEQELLQVVEPIAIEAAFEAERMHREQQEDQQRILDMEMQQARYEASLAERRYAACDPDNRPIAAQLEKNWGMLESISTRPSLRKHSRAARLEVA
jgi:hypothetical protein